MRVVDVGVRTHTPKRPPADRAAGRAPPTARLGFSRLKSGSVRLGARGHFERISEAGRCGSAGGAPEILDLRPYLGVNYIGSTMKRSSDVFELR